ncbi:Sporulation-specific protein [Wickerhamomyces ciferrii]|uniref:Sporulation-specific protein n=1 Tax=Wickerhamomyces ciferrii (strain ATCC 14091 / BCRC 22168 / CBS 111 / JCM 3599 / NBRC 0793 / NRRL Y-1031 F-60-10) TaxID=1206466 RepID=K0KW97_WICCF|nr:Sporulation-specific protein [Wickerhamomyces ciferrii]CCH45423.1 Sporulation-specific protein [Wickerhamomyces ciferrii]
MKIFTILQSSFVLSAVFAAVLPDSNDSNQLELNPLEDDESSSSNDDSNDDIPTLCSKGEYVISSSAQLEQLYECDDIIGSLIISNYQQPTIDTGDIKTISGDFVVVNATNLVRVDTPKLRKVGGEFVLKELTSLTSLNLPRLTQIGSIRWNVLPILSTVSFGDNVEKISSIIISDTSLIGFAGFNVEYLDILNLNNNRFLESINLNLKGVKQQLSVSANAKNILVSFPHLEWANNVTIKDVSSINLDAIEKVNSSLEVIDNNFQAFKLPKLSSVGGTLSLIENYNLKEIEFPNVSEIGGGLKIVNNTQVGKINFFPKLNVIGGAIEFLGDFKEASFNKLKLVKGSAIINSKSDGLDCSKWIHGGSTDDSVGASIIRGGNIVCTAGSKQQTIKFDQEGEIIDEEISIIEDNDSKRKNVDYSNNGNKLSWKIDLTDFIFGLGILLLVSI